MLIKNKTGDVQNCDGKMIRPWRDEVVSDDIVIDENIFEIIGEQKKGKREVDYDLNKDGKFDKADRSIAAKIMKKK